MIVLEHVLNISFFYSDISLTEKWESGEEEVFLRGKFQFRMIHDCLTFIIDGENFPFDSGIKKISYNDVKDKMLSPLRNFSLYRIIKRKMTFKSCKIIINLSYFSCKNS